jgi:hypothetical protein
MMPSRRAFLFSAGAATLAVPGAAGFLASRTPSRALAPWDEAHRAAWSDPRMRALAYAVLAPNPHNRQPWIVELRGESELMVFCDLGRRLPETDPFDRQIVIGFGCFLELFRMAASREGLATEIEPFPEGEPRPRLDGRPVARLRVAPMAPASDPLFAEILRRRSNKRPFDVARPVAAETLLRLVEGIGGAEATIDPARVAALRDLTWRAFEREFTLERTLMESVRLMRIGKAEIEASPDGIFLGGPMMEALRLVGVISREQMADPASAAFRQGLDTYRAIMGSAMGYVWLTSAAETRRAELAAGRDWVRLNLRASALGLDVHPVSQALQEFPEMAELFAAVHRHLGVAPGRRLQMLGRVGYGPAMPPSPRWPLETRIRTA